MILSLLRIQDLVPRSTWLQPIKLLPAIFLYVFIPDQCYRSIFSWIVPRIEIVYNKILYDENISRERIDLVDELNRFIEKRKKKKRNEKSVTRVKNYSWKPSIYEAIWQCWSVPVKYLLHPNSARLFTIDSHA